jgi:hypothetical protein
LGHIQARTASGAALPVPVVQMCSDHILAIILVACTIFASLAWIGILRWAVPAPALAVCVITAAAVSLAFPYVATTDPYAYALYGFQAAHGHTPYLTVQNSAAAPSTALRTLYDFFPADSTNRRANYGPAAVLEYHAAALAARDSLTRFLNLQRLVNISLICVLGWLLTLLRPPGQRKIDAAFSAFHPLLLIESVAFMHGDILMMVLLCLALLAYRKDRVAVCASLIVLAAEVRVIAGLALIAVLMQCAQDRRTRDLLKALSASSATFAATAALAIVTYHAFTLGGSPAIDAYSSPLILAFDSFGVSLQHLSQGGSLQALFGLTLVIIALRARNYRFVPLSALAILPVLRGWYCQWIVPQIALEAKASVRYAGAALAGVAIIAEWPSMTGNSDLTTWAIILSLQWLPPVLALVICESRSSRERLPRAAQVPPTSVPLRSTTQGRFRRAPSVYTHPMKIAPDLDAAPDREPA